MKHLLTILPFLIAAASASPSQQSVAGKFQAVLAAEARAFIDDQLDGRADHPDAVRFRQEMEKKIEDRRPLEMKALEQEFATTKAEATQLLETGPDKSAATKAIRSNLEELKKHSTPMPAMTGFMIRKFNANPDQDPWYLETLKRLTNGLVRKAKEVEEEAGE